MPPPDFLKSFLDPSTPKAVRLAAARGIAPLPPREMIELLVQLTRDSDPQVSAMAGTTISGWPEDEILSEAKSQDCGTDVLEYLASASSSEAVLEAIILNPTTTPRVIETLAQTVPGYLLEIILYNKVRILETPEILANVKLNPSITAEARRLVQEIEAEFFGAKNRAYSVETATEQPETAQPTTAEDEIPLSDLSPLEGLPVDPEAREGALLERLARMSVPQKIHHAMFGTREIRAILVRDHNKEVARSVLRSPKLSSNEVESFASMRNVSDEVLREIGNSREWTRSYAVLQNLVKNPRTPPYISQGMLGRLQTRDLAILARDRGIPEVVRRYAQRLASQRAISKQTG